MPSLKEVLLAIMLRNSNSDPISNMFSAEKVMRQTSILKTSKILIWRRDDRALSDFTLKEA